MAPYRKEPEPAPPLRKDMGEAFDPWKPRPTGTLTMSGMARALEKRRQTGGYKRMGLER